MSDALFLKISRALDAEDGLEGDVSLQRELAKNPRAAQLAEELQELDAGLRALPEPPEVDFEALAARIDNAILEEGPGQAEAPALETNKNEKKAEAKKAKPEKTAAEDAQGEEAKPEKKVYVPAAPNSIPVAVDLGESSPPDELIRTIWIRSPPSMLESEPPGPPMVIPAAPPVPTAPSAATAPPVPTGAAASGAPPFPPVHDWSRLLRRRRRPSLSMIQVG